MTLGDVRFSQDGGLLVAELVGEIDLSNAERIGEAIVETCTNQALGVILDLGGLGYLDSAGIQLVFRLREALRARGQTLALVLPPGSASHDALRLAGVTLHLDTFETRGAALASASSAAGDDDAGGSAGDHESPAGERA